MNEGSIFNPDMDSTSTAVCLSVRNGFFKQLRWAHQTSTSANILLPMLMLGKATSKSVMRKTTGLASINPTYNITSNELHGPKII